MEWFIKNRDNLCNVKQTIGETKWMEQVARPHNIRFGNMAGRRIYAQLFVRYQQQSGLDFYY